MRDRRYGGGTRLIRTLPRKGVRFIGAVREEQKPAPAQKPEGAIAPAEHPSPALPLPDRPSIAVLPFVNMSGDPEQDYFADGMAEEIITALSRCSWLFVIARNSSFTYRGKPVDVREVGRELGVRYVLEGSVRRGGDRLRFTGQLIDATSGGISGPIGSKAMWVTCSTFRTGSPKVSSRQSNRSCSWQKSSG
jgi:TolB-like protein